MMRKAPPEWAAGGDLLAKRLAGRPLTAPAPRLLRPVSPKAELEGEQ